MTSFDFAQSISDQTSVSCAATEIGNAATRAPSSTPNPIRFPGASLNGIALTTEIGGSHQARDIGVRNRLAFRHALGRQQIPLVSPLAGRTNLARCDTDIIVGAGEPDVIALTHGPGSDKILGT